VTYGLRNQPKPQAVLANCQDGARCVILAASQTNKLEIPKVPYIKQARREAILSGAKPREAGELNFAITVLVDNYLADKGEIRYAHINEVIGALECAKLELYRRVAVPYEDKKIAESGDVYFSNKPLKPPNNS